MAKNTGKGFRTGSIQNRSQTFNSKTNQYIKRNTETGLFVSSKDTPFKNIKKEDSKDKSKTDTNLKKKIFIK
ncbi:Hypothetical protein KVN_LOCUS221 [uncultured virus]|nr:Hypothetical protein KVN_LOCUS221 [uncultured virus]